MTRKQRNAVALATTVLCVAGGGGVAWACTGNGDPGWNGTTDTTSATGTASTTGTTGTTTTSGTGTTSTAAATAATRRLSRRHAAGRASHSRRER